MLKLYWDTETSGFKEPWLLEIGGVLVNDADQEMWTCNSLVQVPNECPIEAGAYAIHGITVEQCQRDGIPLASACTLFVEQCAIAELLCGYNLDYDLDVMRRACIRADVPFPELPKTLDLAPWATQLAQIDPTLKMQKHGRFHYKTPNLAQAMRSICNEHDYKGHRAHHDAQAARRLHRAIKEKLDASKDQSSRSKEAPIDGSSAPQASS